MTSKEIVREILAKKGIRQITIAQRLGTSKQAVQYLLKDIKCKDMQIQKMCDLLELGDYMLVAMPKSEPIPTNSYIVGDNNESAVPKL